MKRVIVMFILFAAIGLTGCSGGGDAEGGETGASKAKLQICNYSAATFESISFAGQTVTNYGSFDVSDVLTVEVGTYQVEYIISGTTYTSTSSYTLEENKSYQLAYGATEVGGSAHWIFAETTDF